MHLTSVATGTLTLLEGAHGASYLARAEDVDRLIEACMAEGVHHVLLYAANLSPAFFDLSSGEAGVILQKLRQYHIRLAVVAPPGSVTFSSRFGEMAADERRGAYFGVFDDRETAYTWLVQSGG